MEKRKQTLIYEVKRDGKWIETYRNENPADINERLAHAMIAHYFNEAEYITRAVRKNNMDGTYTITFYESFGREPGRLVITVNF